MVLTPKSPELVTRTYREILPAYLTPGWRIPSDDAKQDIVDHAEAYPKEEVCGVVVSDRVFRGANVSPTPGSAFILDSDTSDIWASAVRDDKQVWVYHSHLLPEESFFSPRDATSIIHTGARSILYNSAVSYFTYYDPIVIRPYTQRPWDGVLNNCYSVVREWLSREIGIEMEWFQLSEDQEWMKPGWDRFSSNLPNQGFTKVYAGAPLAGTHTLKRGDFLTINFGSQRGTHCAVIVDHETNEMLHHLYQSLSCVCAYGHSYRNLTTGVWRHESQI